LLDVFPKETREKGVELWEQWDTDVVQLVRVTVPYNEKKTRHYLFKRADIEKALREHTELRLDMTSPPPSPSRQFGG
jgi:hypothetical protein